MVRRTHLCDRHRDRLVASEEAIHIEGNGETAADLKEEMRATGTARFMAVSGRTRRCLPAEDRRA